MNERESEQISQFIDGEMTASDARDFRERLLADPGLRARFEQVKSADSRVAEAFAGIEHETVPAQVVQALAGVNTASSGRAAVLSWPRGAIAASVVAAAVLLVAPDWRQDGGAPVQGGFASTLDTAFEKAASRAEGWDALDDGSRVRLLLSFRNQAGAWCREFLLAGASQVQRGVACRAGSSAWSTEVLVPEAMPEAATEYRPAGSSDVDEVASYVSQHAQGDVLSLAEEVEVISRKWQ